MNGKEKVSINKNIKIYFLESEAIENYYFVILVFKI
jgi:hypothetical protein